MKKYLLFIIVILFTACSYKTTPVIVAFKKDKLAINDQGFLKENSFAKKIEVYNVGQLVFVLKITKNQICINQKCYDKVLFIKRLNPNYPSDFFSIIIDKKPLPNISIKYIKNGFIQKTDTILYIVTKDKVIFRDKAKKFLFLLKPQN